MSLSSLDSAVQRLDEGLVRYQSDTTDTQIRDGLIRRFVFTYGLFHKTLRRFMRTAAADPTGFEEAAFQYLIRLADEPGLLLGAWPQWRVYRHMRAKTSHTYDEAVALKVVAGIPDFLNEARYLLAQLVDKQHQSP